MRRQLGSGLRRHQHVPVRVAKITTAGIGTPGRIIVVQLEHAGRNSVDAGLCQDEPTDGDQGTRSLQRNTDQTFIIGRVPVHAVAGLILAKRGTEQHQVLSGGNPRAEPGGYGRERSLWSCRDLGCYHQPFPMLVITPIAKGA